MEELGQARLRKKLMVSIIALISLCEESEKGAVSYNSLNKIQKNMDEITALLNDHKRYLEFVNAELQPAGH